MKRPLLLCGVALLILSSCNTLANRRDLYRPTEPDGHYTTMYHKMIYRGQDWAKPLPPEDLKIEVRAAPIQPVGSPHSL